MKSEAPQTVLVRYGEIGIKSPEVRARFGAAIAAVVVNLRFLVYGAALSPRFAGYL